MSYYDVVYFVKDTERNEELKYSLRSLEQNWKYNKVWFCGGCPSDLEPDKKLRFKQKGLNKWEKVRNSLRIACENPEITEDFWLFNDDFYLLKPYKRNIKPQYNGEITDYINTIVSKHGGSHSEYTSRLLQTIKTLEKAGCTTLNYEVHKPMLINKQRAIEVMDKFPGVGGFRSLYGNYYKIGGVDNHDMKIRVLAYDKIDLVENNWGFLSTSDKSFRDGVVGSFVREKFTERSRFEK